MRRLLASLAVCLFSVHAAGQTVGMLGDWQKIEFEGLEQVDADEIRHALATDLEYQAAARPSASLEEFLKVTEARITQGFRYSGYIKANVEVGHDAKRGCVIVLVDEGAKYTMGEIRVVGNKQIDSELIKKSLTSLPRVRSWSYVFRDEFLGLMSRSERNKTNAAWIPGDTARFDEKQRVYISDQVCLAICDAGHITSNFRMAPECDDSEKKVHLRIEIVDEKPPVVLEKFAFRGLTRHSEKDVLDYLQFSRGTILNADSVDQIYEKLRQSCRFWHHAMCVGIVTTEESNGTKTKALQVFVDVVEYPHVPMLNEPLSEVDDALRKAAYWFENYGMNAATSTDDMVIEVNSLSGFSQGSVYYSPANGWIATSKGRFGGTYSVDHAVIVGKDETAAYSWLQHRKLSLPRSCVMSKLHVYPSISDGVKYQPGCQFSFGLNSDTTSQHIPSRMDISIEPVAFVEYAHRAGIQSSISNGRVRLWGKNASVVVEADTGRIIEIAAKSEELQFSESTRIYFKPHAFEEEIERIHKRANSFVAENDNSGSLFAILQFALADAMEQPVVKRNIGLASLLLDVNKLVDSKEVKSYFSSLESKLTQDATIDTAQFTIPLSERIQKDTTAEWGGYFLALADLTFPRGSWHWTISREVAMKIMVGDDGLEVDERIAAEFWRSITEQTPGPVFSLLVAEHCLKSCPEFARMAIVNGMSRLDDDAFLRDINPFTEGELGAAKLVESLVLHCEELDEPETNLILAISPEQLRLPLEKLFTRRKSRPDENPREALRTVLLECFRETWREQMRGQFAFLASEPDDLATQPPLGPYPSTGIGPNDPWQIAPLAPPTERYPSTSLPGSLAEPATASETWQELK